MIKNNKYEFINRLNMCKTKNKLINFCFKHSFREIKFNKKKPTKMRIIIANKLIYKNMNNKNETKIFIKMWANIQK